MSTLNPEEIRKLPMRRDLPYNGLTREQVVAIGADPDEIEASRIANNEWAAQQRISEDAELALAAQQAVANGDATWAEAARALQAAGRGDAHDAVVRMWREEESWYLEQDAADDFAVLDADQYVEHYNEQQVREREQLAHDVQENAQQLEAAKLRLLTERFRRFVESTPGAHAIAPAAEKRLIEKIRQDGTLPTTEAEANDMVESALKESEVLGAASESLRQQVDAEWRIQRRQNGARDGLTTAADIAKAEAHYKEARFAQLADDRMIDLESMKPGPSAEEQSSALVEKYAARQAKSTDFHQAVGDIAKRGAEAKVTRDRGEGIAEEKARYREALARAEADAHYGTAEVKTGYASTHDATVEGAEKGTQLDEYGGAFPGFQQG